MAAPGPKISRFERPRAVRRSRSGALLLREVRGDLRREPVEPTDLGSSYATDVSASRLITLADQLEHNGRLELTGSLA